jgi:hypothetical protein
MIIPGFIGPSYVAQSPVVGADELYNLFVEVEQVPGQNEPKAALYRDPGLRTFTTCGAGPVRGVYRLDGQVWVASGAGLYEVLSDGTATLRGAIAAGDGPATFASNGTGGLQLAVLASGYLYVLNLTTNVLTLVADADLAAYQGRIASIGFVDGYGLVHIENTAQFFASALEDFTSWDPTDVFQKSRTADKVKVMVVDHGQAWLFGSETIEPWYDQGDANTPFAPVPDVMIMQGILSRDAYTLIDNTIFWAGETEDGGRVVYRAAGFNPQRISTHALEAEWRTYSTIDDVTCWAYSHQGHNFVQFDFPTEGVSWAFDTQGFWHKRGYWNVNTGAYEAHLGRCHVYAFHKHLVGSRVDGTVYEQTADVYSDGSAPHRWLRRAPALNRELLNIVHGNFYLHAEVGSTPLLSGQGSDPQVMLRFSDTSGRTWSVERWRSMGAQGAYTTPMIWERLGLARGPQGRVYEVSGTDPVPIALVEAGVNGRRK